MSLQIENSCGIAVSASAHDDRLEDTARVSGKSDEHLVEKAKAGDTLAFEMLIQRHAQRVYFSVYRIMENHEDAEDVMQEAFVRTYTHMASFEGRSRFSTWFTTIAINQALMCLRRKRKQRIHVPISVDEDQEFTLPDLPDTRPNAEVEAERGELACVLGKATHLLPHSLRSVFYLRVFDELSTEEAARALGLSVATVKSRMLRARRHLKKRLAEQHPQLRPTLLS
jgi:RNA polymerase sigma-70 factor, ECF subfamily